jgi:hypothetical protein
MVCLTVGFAIDDAWFCLLDDVYQIWQGLGENGVMVAIRLGSDWEGKGFRVGMMRQPLKLARATREAGVSSWQFIGIGAVWDWVGGGRV